MNKNEIKKELYKQKPTAYLIEETDVVMIYSSEIINKKLTFNVLKSDIGDAKFEKEMDAKLMIRWLEY